MCCPSLVNYFYLFLIFPNDQLGRAAQSTSPPIRAALSDLSPPSLSPPSFIVHFTAFFSPRPVNRKQMSKFWLTSQRTKAHDQLCAQVALHLHPLSPREQKTTLGMPAVQFHLAGILPHPEPSSNWRV